jgi:hypothetical protein
VTPRRLRLPESRVWLRLAEPEWEDPLDPSFAAAAGGRWNPPDSYPVLYLNGDVQTARLQIERMLAGSPVHVDDLDDGAYVLVAATLPRSQQCADAVTDSGLRALGLPPTYPLDRSGGTELGHATCQSIGMVLHGEALRGVWCRSACTSDGRGRELAWFPATRRSRARPVWDDPLPLSRWRDAGGWSELRLAEQPDPDPAA